MLTVDVAAEEAAARKLPLRLMVSLHPRSAVNAPPAHRAAGSDGGLLVERARRRVAHAYPDLPVSATVAVGHHRRHPGTGGVAAAVALRAACPVIVVPAGAGGRGRWPSTRPVVVGVNGGEGDAPAVAFGLAEAAQRDVPLRAVHVWLNAPDMELASVDPFVYDLAEAGRDADRLIQAALHGWADKYPQVMVERAPMYRLDVADTLIGVSADAGSVVVGPM
jgi:hypothetical protein